MNNHNQSKYSGVIWITGYSGAGKTTVAQLVNDKLKLAGIPVVFLDGDEIRSILGERYGHDLNDRRQLASVYTRLCKKIADCGVTVVISTVAMFEATRLENRISNSRYLEVYLDVPLEIRKERDTKGLYKTSTPANLKGNSTPLGLEEPTNPDLTILNYGDNLPDSAASLIASKYLELIDTEGGIQDKNFKDELPNTIESARSSYWESFYSRRRAPITPSSFAIFCNVNYLRENSHVLEFGCGNGRDSFYFSKYHSVTAVDESKTAIEANLARAEQEGLPKINFLCGQFGTKIEGLPKGVDAIYARFVLHAMPEDAETMALSEAYRLLRLGGKLLLEFRTNKDELMSQGVHISDTERVTDHYRRFIDFQKLCSKVAKLGFVLDFSVEKRGLAAYKNDDPVVGRVIATKS